MYVCVCVSNFHFSIMPLKLFILSRFTIATIICAALEILSLLSAAAMIIEPIYLNWSRGLED